MNIGYLILAHKNPHQLLSLIRLIYNDEDCFVVHLDVRCSLDDFQKLFMEYEQVVFLKERHESEWGSFGLIDATLSGLRFIQTIDRVSRIVMLSGQDYPIKSPFHIKKWLEKVPSHIFMECFSVPWTQWEDGGIGRFPYYDRVRQVMDLYAGSQWCSFPLSVIQVIFDFLDLNPLFIAYFKTVFIPDECFFQTLLMNSGKEEIVKNITGENLHLIRWDTPGNHPNILSDKDMLLIIQSEKLFARKFEIGSSSSVLHYIDQNVWPEKKEIDYPRRFNHKKKETQAICFLTNKDEEGILHRYRKLKTEVASFGDTRLFFHHDRATEMSNSLQENDPFVFTSDILFEIGYKSIFNDDLSGSNHFPLLKFFRENSNYDYYWYIEDDVYYNDSWDKFFSFFLGSNLKTDFITAHIRDYMEEPYWFWWDTLKFKSVVQPNTLKIRSFNPLFRISNKALKLIDQYLMQGWEGHFEVLLPTLLKTTGFSIAEFGGVGSYVLPGCENKFYTASKHDNSGRLSTGTFRHRPVIGEEEVNHPFIYHPVK